MTDAELKKLKRNELLQMLIEQSKTVEALKAELEKKNKLLEERSIAINEAGSIADAALKLNGVFEAAQAAAEQYLESVKEQCQSGSIIFVKNENKSSDENKSADENKSSDNKHDDGNKINQRLRRIKMANRNW